MSQKLLTDRFVASAKSTDRTNYFDTHTTGLALRVTRTGAKSWYFVYRANGSPSQWERLGTVGGKDGMSLAKARQAVRKRRALVDEGRNPAAERKAAREAAKAPAPAVYTVGKLCDLYETVAAGQKKTWKDDVAKINKYIRPAWGTLPLRTLNRQHVHELLDGLVSGGMTVGVNRIQALISRLLTIAVDRSLIDSHPAARMEKRFKEKPAERVLTDAELRTLSAGLDENPGRAADAVRLRMLTGQRGEEVAGMGWSEIDLEAKLWQLPGERTKNGRPHTLPLSQTAVTLITRLHKAKGDDLRVFPYLTLRSDDHRALATIHSGAYEWKDLRRTVATRLAGLGFSETTIGRVLNHARVSVTAKHYNQHGYVDEKRAALDAWDAELARIVANETAKPAKVLKHRARGQR